MSAPDIIQIDGYPHRRYRPILISQSEILQRSKSFYEWMDQRRSVRDIDTKDIPRQVIENILLTAATAPSGAHKQPWTFCAIADEALKKQIRKAAEEEERENYESRMSEKWKEDLRPLGTDMNKPFLEKAPWLIVVFKQVYEKNKDGQKCPNYYVNESVGIACGFLLSAIHHAGLVTLTHTPSPMNFLTKILNRPENERPFLICPVGYAKEPVYVPDINRKPLNAISHFYE